MIDDNDLVISTLERWMRPMPELEWLGSATAGEEGVRLVALATPDVVLLDVLLPGEDSVELLRRIRIVSPRSAVVMFSGVVDPEQMDRALDGGAAGYVVKDERVPELARLVQLAAAGEVVLSATARRALALGGSPRADA